MYIQWKLADYNRYFDVEHGLMEFRALCLFSYDDAINSLPIGYN